MARRSFGSQLPKKLIARLGQMQNELLSRLLDGLEHFGAAEKKAREEKERHVE